LALRLMLILVFAKMIAFALTVSSGGSGGVFAPSLYVGAMLGAAFALPSHQPSAVFAVVGMAAVFGAAARVPVATMLMVTEMAGGYHLLIPAGLAVMLSYLLHVRLSSRLKYSSLYEGQVPTRKDSPAHYLEQIQSAMRLLTSRNVPVSDEVSHLELLPLLRSRIHFDLPGDKQLTMGVLRDDSGLAGKTIADFYQQVKQAFEIVAVLRREHVLLPHPRTILTSGDRLVLITSPEARKALPRYIAPSSPAQEGDAPPSLPSAAA